MKFIGLCKECEKVFCHLHRYQESHNCSKLREKKELELKRLSDKLFNESTKRIKINHL
jgi:predicted nucleic acid binding AN1-type Zn finger protein